MVLRFTCALQSPGGLLKQIAGPHPERLGDSLRICISNEFSDDAGGGGQTTLQEPLTYRIARPTVFLRNLKQEILRARST